MDMSINSAGVVTDIIRADEPVALTAPLCLKDLALVGFYSKIRGPGCIQVPLKDLPAAGKALYLPSDGRIIAHGLKHIWEYLGVGDPDLDAKLITDTKRFHPCLFHSPRKKVT